MSDQSKTITGGYATAAAAEFTFNEAIGTGGVVAARTPMEYTLVERAVPRSLGPLQRREAPPNSTIAAGLSSPNARVQ
jgi:hypothetical protein